MRAEHWQRVKEIFHVACGLPDKERASYLESECGDDQLLRSEVESLLESAEADDTFLETPALEATARSISKEKSAALLGQTLGHYKILELIGAGGMGEVYLARDKRLGRKVALKLLPDYFTNDEERLRRFQREARAASALNHPNILTVYEIGKVGASHFIAAEFIDGQTLRERIRGSRLTMLEALDVALQTAGALAAAHAAGIIHRDIKPENIMVRKDGYVKVLDFGLAKLVEHQKEPESLSDVSTQALVHTAAGVVMGTALYMSPEQARGREVAAQTDIWSLGCVLYEMLSGRPPFEGETPSHVVVSILDKEPLPLKTRAREAIPAELEAIVARTLRKKPEERYQTADDLALALRSLKQKLEIEAALEGSRQSEQRTKSLDQSSAPTIITETHEEQRTATGQAEAKQTHISARHAAGEKNFWTKRNVAIVGALAVVALAATAFGIYKLTQRTQSVVSNAFAKTRLMKLTTSGKAGYPAISPNGQFVAHVSGERGKQSIVLKHVATGSDKEIVPVTGDNYSALAFSHDGNYIYYHRYEKVQDVLYRVPFLGGIAPTRLSEDINSTVALSPDDKRLAFVRGYPQEGTCSLILANADGTGEERFLIRKGGDLFPFGVAGQAFAPAWSPDGEMIAFQSRGNSPSSGTSHIEIIQVKDKQVRTLTTQKWTGIGQISWLADGSGLLLTAAEDSSGAFQQIWYVAYPTGEARKVTNDLNNYFGVSLTADGSALVTMQAEQLSNIWVLPDGDTKRAVKVSTGKTEGDDGVAWTPDGKIVYTSSTTGDQDIWMMNADGSDQKQLTRNARRSSGSVVTPDGRYIVFASTRTGERRIWRIDVDGGNPKQLTSGSNDQYPCLTPDGQWVIYVDASINTTLWKVPIDGGTPTQITDYYTYKPSVSPDGKWIAALFIDDRATPKRYYASIIPFEGGKPSREFDFPVSRMRYLWTPDSRSLIYIDTRAGVSNLWQQPIDGGKPTQITEFASDQIFWFDYSRDHHQLALARGTQASDVVLINDLK